MVDDQLVQSFSVEPAHITHYVDSAVVLEVASRMEMALHYLFLGSDRVQLHHRQIAALSECARLVEDVGDAAGHARSKVASSLADNHDDAAGHVLAAVISRTLDNRDRA